MPAPVPDLAPSHDDLATARKLARERGVDLGADYPGWDVDGRVTVRAILRMMAPIGRAKGPPAAPEPNRLALARALSERLGLDLPDDWDSDVRVTDAFIALAERAAVQRGT